MILKLKRFVEIWERRKERNVLFNDTLSTFYLRLYSIRHMVKDHTDMKFGSDVAP